MTHPDKRPILIVTLSLILVLYHITGAFQVLQLPESIGVHTSIPPIVQAVLHMGWAIVFTLNAVLLLRRQRNAMRFNQGAWVLFICYGLARLLLFAQADYDRQRLPFLLILTVPLLLGPVIKAATLLWRHIKEKRGYPLW